MAFPIEDLQNFAETLRASGKQPATVESYCRDAKRFSEYMNRVNLTLSQVESDTMLHYQEYLRSDCNERENTVRRAVIGVRQYFRFLSQCKAISSTPFDDVAIPDRIEIKPKALSEKNIQNLINACGDSSDNVKAARDAALVALLAFEGIKTTELVQLKWRSLLPSENRLYLNIPGPKERLITLSKDTAPLLRNYQDAHSRIEHPLVAQSREKHMFIAFKGRDASLPLPQMTRHGLKFILYELGDKVGIKHLNAELLRHNAVAHLLREGRTPEEIMAHLGLRRMGNISKHIRQTQSAPEDSL